MDKSINYMVLAPKVMASVLKLETASRKAKLDKGFAELLRLKVSQINGCPYCMNLHSKKAIKFGEEARISALKNWKEEDVFSDKERVCLELAERITLIAQNEISDDLYHVVSKYFSEKEYIEIVMLINTVNLWNRIAIPFGKK